MMRKLAAALSVAAFALTAACVFEEGIDETCFDTGDGVKCVESELEGDDSVGEDVVPYDGPSVESEESESEESASEESESEESASEESVSEESLSEPSYDD